MNMAMQGVALRLAETVVVPMFGTLFLVIALYALLLRRVRNPLLRGVGSYLAVLTWLALISRIYGVA